MNKMTSVVQPKLTIVEVREAYIDRKDFEDQLGHVERRGDEAAGAEFDRWLAEHDAQVLRDAADEWQVDGWADDLPTGMSRPGLILGMAQRATNWLRARADRIAAGGES